MPGTYAETDARVEVPNYPSAKEMLQYIRDYAAHFDLYKLFRLGYRVTNLKRSSDGRQWCLAVISPAGVSEEQLFDKVVVTTGSYCKPFMPRMSGSEGFEGKILHAQAFKEYVNPFSMVLLVMY
jgi:dimethylaniline monooxygenase (N-oxide forming)